MNNHLNIQLLLTGDELMSGDILDSNSAMVAQQLETLGLYLRKKITVGDDLSLLVAQLDQLSRESDILIVNGGLGPTQDDLTATALAQLTGLPLSEHPDALAHLQRWCQRRGHSLNRANLKQALLPQGCDIIDNERGSAVGIRLHHQQCDILCTPGVPSELHAMLEASILPFIEGQSPAINPQLLQRFHVFGLGESNTQQWLNDTYPEWPAAVNVGFRAGAPTLEVKLRSSEQNEALHRQCVEQFRALAGDYIAAEGNQTQAMALVQQLQQHGRKVTTAESCTGGLIASMLTSVSGASSVFEAGYVTYANHIKQQLLGVDPQLLETQGAVSEPVVRQMALGALAASGADYAVAVSGIAGPEGGSPEKPVGTVWIAWGSHDQLHSCCLYYPYSRHLFQTLVAGAALDLIRRFDRGISATPRYLQERCLPTSNSDSTQLHRR